jgi:hypothetical protein
MKKALTLANQGFSFGAGEMNRTPDLLITKAGRAHSLGSFLSVRATPLFVINTLELHHA